MRLILLTLSIMATVQASEYQSGSACEVIESAIYDASQDGTEELTESQYCSEYSDDANCINALKLNCQI